MYVNVMCVDLREEPKQVRFFLVRQQRVYETAPGNTTARIAGMIMFTDPTARCALGQRDRPVSACSCDTPLANKYATR